MAANDRLLGIAVPVRAIPFAILKPVFLIIFKEHLFCFYGFSTYHTGLEIREIVCHCKV